ncbi:MAG: hypothetical protein VW405_22800 [Rhodospirillaceae bacterium]
MFKKFVSNALMSVVMDKKAREKVNALRDAQARPEPAAKSAKSAKPRPDPDDDSELDIPRMLPDEDRKPRPRQKAAPAAGPAPTPSRTRPPVEVDTDDPATLIRQALESAEEELVRRQDRAKNAKPMTAERAALIQNAMAIHRSKAHILDDLPQEQREKLMVMAAQALNDRIDD